MATTVTTLASQTQSTLAEIAGVFAAAAIDYYVGGSVMLALRGFDVEPADIDFVVNGSSRLQVETAFAEAATETVRDPWRSLWLLRTSWEGTSIDVVADLALQIGDSIARFPVVAEDRARVRDATIPLGPLRHWYHLYRIHNPARAKLIAAVLADGEIMQGAKELGIGDSFSPTLIVRIGNESEPVVIEDSMSDDQQSSIIEVASPTDRTFDESGSEVIDVDLLKETLEYIRPALQADGGDLVLLGTEGGKVTLQLVGACGGCPLSTMTLTAGIERIVTDRVPGVTEVVAV
jgi:Fe-S cluster biogenesis protein NfuA